MTPSWLKAVMLGCVKKSDDLWLQLFPRLSLFLKAFVKKTHSNQNDKGKVIL